MHRFFVPKDQISDKTITIIGSDVNHIKNVLRMTLENEIEVIDSNGNSYLSSIKEIKSNIIRANILKPLTNNPELLTKITLAQCLPKAKKMDFIVQKATELGVSHIIPVISERSVPKIEDKTDKKLSHWQKIAKEAAEQSGRTIILEILALTKFEDLIKTAKNYKLALIPWEGEQCLTLKQIPFPDHQITGYPNILIIIGPEGGFSREEIDIAKNSGIIPITLGKRILRTETTGIFLLAQLLYVFE